MTRLLAVFYFISVTCSAIDFGSQIPTGRYEGTGHWIDLYEDVSGEYQVTVEIKANAMKVEYEGDGFSQTLAIDFRFISPNRFNVSVPGAKILAVGIVMTRTVASANLMASPTADR